MNSDSVCQKCGSIIYIVWEHCAWMSAVFWFWQCRGCEALSRIGLNKSLAGSNTSKKTIGYCRIGWLSIHWYQKPPPRVLERFSGSTPIFTVMFLIVWLDGRFQIYGTKNRLMYTVFTSKRWILGDFRFIGGGRCWNGARGKYPKISAPLSHPNQPRRFCEALNGRKFKRDLSVENL